MKDTPVMKRQYIPFKNIISFQEPEIRVICKVKLLTV